MNTFDWVVLLGTMISIATYGAWHTRHTNHLDTYLKGSKTTKWGTIGISVMATQASAITFLSIPGQGFESGIGFVQNYFGLPLALIIVCAVFLPIYRKLGVYTAYEYLGNRFDAKTRLLGAGLFLLQRGLAAGVTIYAPAIILATVLGWRLDLTVIGIGVVVIVYTVTGGSEAVSLTQKWQMGIIFVGMVTAFLLLIARLPDGLGFNEAAHVAGAMGKLQAVDYSMDPEKRYTIWSGLFGGLFLSLSYFGTDQSQVQRYIGGAALREGRLGLMFNAVLKVPMQFFILLIGALLFVFYQFQPAPVFYNRVEWQRHVAGTHGAEFQAVEDKHAQLHAAKSEAIRAWLQVRHSTDAAAETAAREAMLAREAETQAVRQEAKDLLRARDPLAKIKDSDYIFIGFILSQMPHGAIGLLVAVMFAAALSSKAGELNALGTTSTIDLWRHFRPLAAHDERRNVRVAKWWTAVWGLVAIAFALFAGFAENLIEAINIIGSIFYGVVLGIFLVAFFVKWVGGTAVFWAAVISQTAIFAVYFLRLRFPVLDFSYLWYNVIGCTGCVLLSIILQLFLPRAPRKATAQ
ncbi:MAG TPA: sodium:solute symporter [Verrucomicrobiae bacterium]|nr:sodium:solute symporter [Verrucomicrobiae bacterium]